MPSASRKRKSQIDWTCVWKQFGRWAFEHNWIECKCKIRALVEEELRRAR